MTVFLIRLSRGAVVAKELLGEGFAGYLVSDRWSGYSWVELRRRQVCWAHLKRDFQKIADAQGDLARIGQSLLEQTQRLFKLWHRVRDGTLKRSSFATYASAIRGEIRALLEQGLVCADAMTAGMCQKILSVEPAMWTFVRVVGMEPTNRDYMDVMLRGGTGRTTTGKGHCVMRCCGAKAVMEPKARQGVDSLNGSSPW